VAHTIRRDSDKSGITFAANDVTPATELLPRTDYATALQIALGAGGALEAYSRDTGSLAYPSPHPFNFSVHAFVSAANLAYDKHYPLTLSPDMIWLLILQGFAVHLRVNAETLRSRFVAHAGKPTLRVRRDEFVRGFAGNDWESVFTEFSQQIRTHIGADAHAHLVREFTTTGIVEKASMAITAMDALQHYFSYMMVSLCGIPTITLEGTPEDWQAIRDGAAALAEYDLAWWTDLLLPVLDQFVAASRGDIDTEFWRAFYKEEGGSGGPYIGGYIVTFFPYLASPCTPQADIDFQLQVYQEKHGLSPEAAQAKVLASHPENMTLPQRNSRLGWRETIRIPVGPDRYRIESRTLTTDKLPAALSVAPFTWDYRGTELPMEFVAGFIGVTQDAETLALRPEIGWAVRERAIAG